MEFANFWLPILGCGIFIAFGIGAWFSEYKVAGIWLTFAGIVCLLVLAALQVQQSLTDQPSQTEIDIKRVRANVFVDNVKIVNVDDEMATIGPTKLPSASVLIRNFGQTTAHNVVHRISARIAEFPPPLGLFDVKPIGPGSVDNLPLGGRSVATVGIGPALTMDQTTLLGLGRLAAYVFGEIAYNDEFSSVRRCTKYRFMVGGNVGFNGQSMVKMSEGNEVDKDCTL
jgi:hypothetical protein